MMNLKWHDAVAVAAAQFTKAEREAGWPQTMTIEQVAALQRPYLHKTEPGYRASLGKTKAMADAIFQACEKGSIEWSTETRQTHHQITRIVPGDIRYAKRNLYGERVITPRQELAWATKDVQVKAITAQAFAAWLAEPTQDEKPSAHIAAWFEAVAVAADAPAASAPLKAPAATPAKSRFSEQDEVILDKIRELGHDPLNFPKNSPGKRGVKAAVRVELVGIKPFPANGTQFDHAWERLRDRGDIVDQS